MLYIFLLALRDEVSFQVVKWATIFSKFIRQILPCNEFYIDISIYISSLKYTRGLLHPQQPAQNIKNTFCPPFMFRG
jgi:hypothetical protein